MNRVYEAPSDMYASSHNSSKKKSNDLFAKYNYEVEFGNIGLAKCIYAKYERAVKDAESYRELAVIYKGKS